MYLIDIKNLRSPIKLGMTVKFLFKKIHRGDSVYIPAGQSVLLDVSTPILNSVIVEGTLIFEDKDKNFSAHYLICMNGKVQIGTFARPFKSKLIITMYGQKEDIQLPEFGNKVWAFHNGILDLHGLPKKVTWTLLAKTAFIGESSVYFIYILFKILIIF